MKNVCKIANSIAFLIKGVDANHYPIKLLGAKRVLMKRPEIQIEVVSDVVCPWCFIGKRRMEKAIHQLRGEFDFTISYSPFELNPDLPSEGVDQKNYLVKKFGSEEKYNQITEQITQVAQGEGLTFDFSSQKKSPNTRDAHRLLWLAKQEGVQPAVKEAFMKAYFEDGIDLTERSNLIRVAAKAGLTPTRIDDMFARAEGISEVTQSEELNHQRGISGVPFFIINNKYGVSGAQSTDFFVNNFRSIAGEPA